jgi:hypothetical protein
MIVSVVMMEIEQGCRSVNKYVHEYVKHPQQSSFKEEDNFLNDLWNIINTQLDGHEGALLSNHRSDAQLIVQNATIIAHYHRLGYRYGRRLKLLHLLRE